MPDCCQGKWKKLNKEPPRVRSVAALCEMRPVARLAALRIIDHHLRRRFAHFKLGADFLDLRRLLFRTSRQRLQMGARAAQGLSQTGKACKVLPARRPIFPLRIFDKLYGLSSI